MKILAVNGGSSSFKANLFDIDPAAQDAPRLLWDARIEGNRQEGIAAVAISAPGHARDESILSAAAPVDALAPVVRRLWEGPGAVLRSSAELDGIGHRIVHGGAEFSCAVRVTPQVQDAIVRLGCFAPEHNHQQAAGIDALAKLLGTSVPQFVVFDTAFHSTLEPAAYVYPLPYEWLEAGIRRYGFHGISHQYVSSRVAALLGRDLASLRIITCHLGNGASLCAVKGGRSVNTTMGFTPLEGLMMGTRSGSVDPAILVHMVRHHGYGADDLDRVLNKQSGLKGVSGVTSDMRDLLTAIEEGNERARLAYDMYLHRLSAAIASLLPDLGGVDAIAFAGGIGEHGTELRAAVAESLAFIGVKLDGEKNEHGSGDRDIAAADSAVRVLVIQTREEREIAREVARLLYCGAGPPACEGAPAPAP